MAHYTVSAFKLIETEAGMIEDYAPAKMERASTSTQAEKLATQWAQAGDYSSIYISYIKKPGGSACYYNPASGFDSVGKDWNSHILAR